MIAKINNRLQRRRASASERPSFRQRYQAAEARRGAMIERLQSLDQQARSHPAHRRALTLLNVTFRKAKIAQRVAILQSAQWLIDVLETLTLIA